MAKLSFGSCYWSTPAATANVTGTPIKAAGTTTAVAEEDFTMSADNRLTYDGATTRWFEVLFTGSVTKAAGTTTQAEFSIYKDGVFITGSDVQRQIPSGDEGAFAVSCHTQIDPGSYVELWCETVDTGNDLTIQHGVLSVKVLG